MSILKVYNTLTRKKEDFKPQEKDRVKMYVCGPTVYDYFHIGNARPFIVFDVFRRYLKSFKGYKVTYVQNITDVDDKIINKAAACETTPQEVAERFTESYWEDLKKLGVKQADHQPKATERIDQMITFIQDLVDKGYAYPAEGDVYFSVAKFNQYGKLSGKRVEDLESGQRIQVDEKKKDPLDFALWKKAKPGEPKWDSPWGPGRPGWHIECSVMATSTLGETIDIHAGGEDLIFPHHENEIAQAEAKTGKPFAKYWLHNALLNFEGQKMSKSLGNFEYARDIVEKYGKEAVRYFYLSKHYRKPINFSHRNLQEVKSAVNRVYNLLEEAELELERLGGDNLETKQSGFSQSGEQFYQYVKEAKDHFEEEMDNDFNTAGGLGVIFELVKRANRFRQDIQKSDLPLMKTAVDTIRDLGKPLGLFQEVRGEKERIGLEEEMIELLIEVRNKLREKEEWDLADEIRTKLKDMGIILQDKEKATIWKFDK